MIRTSTGCKIVFEPSPLVDVLLKSVLSSDPSELREVAEKITVSD
jgi:hypothetical protein